MNGGTYGSKILQSALLVAGFLSAAPNVAVTGDSYPSRTVKIIAPVTPGPIADTLPRIVADKLAIRWGQPVIIENRPGAANNIGAAAAAKAEPDGYTLLAAPPPPLVINQSLYPKLGFDPNAFVPVTVIASQPNVLVAHPKVPFSDLQGLIAYAKANPNKLSYGSPGTGSVQHLAMEQLKTVAGIQIVHIPYKGLAPAFTDLLAGQVDIMFDNLGNSLRHVDGGKLKFLGVGTQKRIAQLPAIPALSESFPGFDSIGWYAMVAPPKTSPAIAEKVSQAVAEILRLPDVAKRFHDLSATPVGSSPAATAAFLQQETGRWREVIRAAGIKAD